MEIKVSEKFANSVNRVATEMNINCTAKVIYITADKWNELEKKYNIADAYCYGDETSGGKIRIIKVDNNGQVKYITTPYLRYLLHKGFFRAYNFTESVITFIF